MPARLSRRAPRAIATVAAGCAATLVLAVPALARPGAQPPVYDGSAGRVAPVVHATLGTADQAPSSGPRAQAPTSSLAGTTSDSPFVNAPGTDVAAPDQQNPIPEPGPQPGAAPVLERPRVVTVERGAETPAVLAIAAAALLAGAAAGFAGGRHTVLRPG